MRNLFLLAMSTLVFISFAGCSAKEKTSAPGPVIEEKTRPETDARPSWQVEWDRTIIEAKKEGKVVLYSSFSPETRIALIEAFKQKYGIDMEVTVGRGGEIAEKGVREHRSGLYLVDVYVSGVTTLLLSVKPAGLLGKIEPLLILPEVKDPQIWWVKRLPFLDKDNLIFSFISYPTAPVTFHKDFFRAEEFTSMRDILNPKWKGKISIDDPTVSGTGSQWFSVYGEVLMDLDFMRAFARMEPVLLKDERLQVEWIARGRYPVGVAASSDIVTEFLKVGAPLVEHTPREGTYVTSGSGSVSFVEKAPHPNAARLFINWLVSREGQTIFARTMGRQSAREDVPTDFLLPTRIRQPGLKYVRTDDEEWRLGMNRRMETAREIFAPLKK